MAQQSVISQKTLNDFVRVNVYRKEPYMMVQNGGTKEFVYKYNYKERKKVVPSLREKFVNSVDMGKLKRTAFFGFMLKFKNSIESAIIKKEYLIEDIDLDRQASKKNKDKFKALPVGSTFVSYDMSSCYWQMAYRLGYIDKDFYKQFIYDDDYKNAKRLCVSFLGRTKSCTYYRMDGSEDKTIVCNVEIFRMVYKAIRNLGHNIIFGALDLVDNDFYWYNVDCITVDIDKADILSEYFKKEKIEVAVTLCKKISETEFVAGTKIDSRFK